MARSKKEIDRELMYKKILPTAMAVDGAVGKAAGKTIPGRGVEQTLPTATGTAGQKPPVEVVFSPPVAAEAVSPKPAEPGAQPPPQAKEAQVVGQVQPAAGPQPEAPACVAEPPLVNLMEAFVEKRLDTALKKFRCCSCERCRKDVLAIALNKLPPLYVIEDDPDIRDLHERERASQVATALVQAILAVKARPLHETSR